ncbi:L,D-transpeptidase [Streptomyces sp. UNOC14_S4]|uniref:L,D-transpeptidase n=1 Tax=Streptomyces sp. UNOC14_S4 TaxID=2872340 RepID=UPI001E653871|nr:L,D-transpeptidase [Streptomyces sp. UNOC14_S4]MCC3769434.1 L,D-transpeptidase [Streptomyces sp. UNOC14_S4]
MARSSSGAVVAALTAAALAGVGFLAYQADAAPHQPHVAASSAGRDGKDPSADAAAKDKAAREAATAVPANSGTGARVVYSVAGKRVWLVAANGQASRTFEVSPSTVNPPAGTYKVTSRQLNAPGSDGVPVEHIVRFHRDAAGIVFGFSAAVDGSAPDPASTKKTGAIREKPADGRALWEFAVSGATVVVVP